MKRILGMFSSKFNFFWLVGALCLFWCAGCSNVNISCAETDKEALLKLKHGFVDESGMLSTWKSEADCCEWSGVSCSNLTGHVIELGLSSLGGGIPSSIAALVALASLNLSRNHLKGCIPINMGQMERLESLDLSYNSLSGEIPISFSNLSFLSMLNLAFNNLSGKIPTSTQLQSFTASGYIGNQGLCGLPLTERCPEDGISNLNPNAHDIDADGDDNLISFGFYASMALGFITGFWGVCGTLILKKSWRHSFFHFFENTHDWIYVQVAILKAKIKRRFQH
ncbi:receptor-like protein EIX2 [Neltuma alba]|uniref:receptor-like protein EIX2 n=1 Tax=Neltuma alba TaxID=207710 RepID=UPI0010A58F4D|nr:receptor-like protein EIX2 [Prosopis alba]